MTDTIEERAIAICAKEFDKPIDRVRAWWSIAPAIMRQKYLALATEEKRREQTVADLHRKRDYQ